MRLIFYLLQAVGQDLQKSSSLTTVYLSRIRGAETRSR